MIEVVIILILILANGFFSGSEIAVVSSRKGRLAQRAEEGSKGARTALELSENPNRFLSTVQIGITVISTLASAFGGASLSALLETWMRTIPALEPYAPGLSFAIVVAFLSYFSLILGELVPKRLALQNAEGIATIVAPVLAGLARVTGPIVSFLTFSSEVVLWVLRRNNTEEAPVNEEDVIALVREGVAEGTVEESEHSLISNVFSFTDRSVASLMTPRTQIVGVNVTSSITDVLDTFLKSNHSRMPVFEGNSDNIVGLLFAQDLLSFWGQADGVDVRSLMRPPVYVLENQRGVDVLEKFRRERETLAVVIDEYGQVAGIITQRDLLDEVVGDFGDDSGDNHMVMVKRDDGSYLVDGLMPVADMQEQLDIPGIDELEKTLHFETAAGLLLAILGHIPEAGEKFSWQSYGFEIVDMDEQRIDKFIIHPPAASGDTHTESLLASGAARPPFSSNHN